MARGGQLKVSTGTAGELKRALNASGWLDDEVIAAGHLRQGNPPSMAAMISGAALIEVLRPRRSKLLPRQFVLAATSDRVVAFKALGVGIGEGSFQTYEARIKPGEQGSFPRSAVRLTDLRGSLAAEGGTLVIGPERIPVTRQAPTRDPNTDELVELLTS